MIWEMHAELGSKEPINIICGYRSRRDQRDAAQDGRRPGQESQHITGKAIDVAFPDVPVKQMRYSALIRERGGVGYYPTSGIPFVHVDSGPRARLAADAALRAGAAVPRRPAPSTSPASGGPITPDDVRVARARHKELANRRSPPTSISATSRRRRSPSPSASPRRTGARRASAAAADRRALAALVSASPPEIAPQLKGSPRLVRASLGGPADADGTRRDDNVRLASLTPPAIAAPARGRPRRPRPPHHRVRRRRARRSPCIWRARPRRGGACGQAEAGLRDRIGFRSSAAQASPRKPTRLAALEPQPAPPHRRPPAMSDAEASGFSDGWAPAPEFDEDHPGGAVLPAVPARAVAHRISVDRRHRAREARASRRRAHARPARRRSRSCCRCACARAGR